MNGWKRQQLVRHTAWTALSAGVIAAGGVLVLAPGASATHVEPVLVVGNPSCPAGTTELKIENPSDGDSASDGDFAVSIDVDEATQTLDFSATGGAVLVAIVKGGPNSNVYNYGPIGTTDDTGLHAPLNEESNPPDDFYGLSHVSFCFGEPTPPTETPPTETPPTETPPTETPPTEQPPTEQPPTEQPPTVQPPPVQPPTDFPAGLGATDVGGTDDDSGLMSWWLAGLIGSGVVVGGGAALALRRRGDHQG